MSQTGQQDLDEALADPGALSKQVGVLVQRQRVRTRVYVGCAALFLMGSVIAIWLSLENPSKAAEATGATIAFWVLCLFQGLLAISSRRQARALQSCREILEVDEEKRR